MVDNKDILTILANADYNQVSIWQLINNNIGETTTKTINNCLIDSTKDRLSINPQDDQLIELLNQFPKIDLIKTHIHVDKMISHDVIVALDGVYTTGENQETKAGMIKVNYGIGKVLIVSGDKARLIGCLTTIVNNNGNCFTPINDDLDRELSSDRFSNLKRNVYMVAKKTAIAQWDYNVRAMLQIKKLKKAIMARNSRSDFYQLMKKLDK
ncbi:hypothetical protein C7B62_16565 [Pleurocapsa sp. CCALA 161]|uniref:hypothetical protein n=1 Tax=Pleurocapsa sp. CCALA 161 TaxID=2107688 RepID=UPI000D0589A0|nr:hypothetical protein [Pleurocapsa sp. CCALA 161]PSB08514.1 hypothetical protein C7B62_16565 [Pleurocapsa sp. CCALA 161]